MSGKVRKTIFCILILVSILFNASVQEPDAFPQPPKLLYPKKDITHNQPTFKWKPEPGSTKYRIQVFKSGTLVISENIQSSTCTNKKCKFKPSSSSKLSLGEHKWRVNAYVGSSWTGYSPKKVFNYVLQSPPFDSQFTSSTAGWSAVQGTWSLNSGSYYTTGVPSSSSSVQRTGEYVNFVYKARIKRTGNEGESNTLIIRGKTYPLGWDEEWNSCYHFQYSSYGIFSVYKIVNGTNSVVKGWTSSAVIKPNNWNTIKVIAKGSSLKFYLNNTLLWSGKDESLLKKGVVGVRVYRNDFSTGNAFWIDYAKLTPIDY